MVIQIKPAFNNWPVVSAGVEKKLPFTNCMLCLCKTQHFHVADQFDNLWKIQNLSLNKQDTWYGIGRSLVPYETVPSLFICEMPDWSIDQCLWY